MKTDFFKQVLPDLVVLDDTEDANFWDSWDEHSLLQIGVFVEMTDQLSSLLPHLQQDLIWCMFLFGQCQLSSLVKLFAIGEDLGVFVTLLNESHISDFLNSLIMAFIQFLQTLFLLNFPALSHNFKLSLDIDMLVLSHLGRPCSWRVIYEALDGLDMEVVEYLQKNIFSYYLWTESIIGLKSLFILDLYY